MPPKKAQPGRKGKKAWRKNVDTAQVEETMHDLRTEERLGGKLHDKHNDDLFSIDKRGDVEVKRKLKYGKLRIDEILTPQSAFTGITSRKAPKTTVEVTAKIGNAQKVRKVSKQHAERVEALVKRKLELGVGRVGAQADLVAAERAIKKRKLEIKKGGFDLWAVDTSVAKIAADEADVEAYLEPVIVKPVKKPVFADTRPVAIPAVEITHAGASYNPSFEAHQSALQKAVDEEEVTIGKRASAAKQLAYPAELDELDDETFFNDDSDDEEDEEEMNDAAAAVATEDDGVDSTDAAAKPPPASSTSDAPVVLPVNGDARKSRAQRNKELKRAELARQELAAKQAKKLDKQLNRLGELAKIVGKEEREHIRRLQERAELQKKLAEEETRRLGPHAFKPLPMDVQLTEDLADTLRELKPEGNLFKDRFASLQKRTLIEARVPISKASKIRYRRKEKETHDYKRFK
ncbi:ribosome biogenesis protein Nop53/GLTSCR2 [Geranomyces variabilis]|nr:ribosome biogenesis protein Nop53/GLTSCR2 [Geranomyces variabilis]KAJ3133856.1 hypothetical protein HDU90_005464 [Geranomyces variabilis]